MFRLLPIAVAFVAAPLVHADPPHARKVPVPAAAAAEDEPLEALALRLAERLGAQRDGHGDGSLVLRVPPRAGAAPAAARVERPAKRRPARSDCDT